MRKTLLVALGALTLTLSTASSAHAGPVEDCLDKVTNDCNRALAESNWVEKIGVGIICTAMYIACGGGSVSVKVS